MGVFTAEFSQLVLIWRIYLSVVISIVDCFAYRRIVAATLNIQQTTLYSDIVHDPDASE